MLGSYGGYILAAYAVVALTMAGLVAKVLLDGRRLKAELARIETAGKGRGGR